MMEVNILLVLLFFCFEVNANSDLDHWLFIVAQQGETDDIAELISDGANLFSEDERKQTPLHIAAAFGNLKVVEYLIEKGIDINAEDNDKNTPLHAAAQRGKAEIVNYLVNNGANIRALNNENKTPHDVARLGKGKAAKLLMGQNITSKTKYTCDLIRGNQLIDERILEGDIAKNGEFPWMAALGYNSNYKISFGCGGTIISEHYVMTAAHCCTGKYPPVLVRVGKVSLKDVYTDETRATNYYIKNITRHPSYSVMTKKNDIALLKLTLKIAFNNAVRPACLHTNIEDVDTATKLIVTGWGNTNPNRESQSNDLRKIAVNTKPLNECNRFYLNYNELANLASFRDGIDPGQYCVFDPEGKRDACQGDSGGPLQYIPNNDPNTVTIVGIVSAGIACGADLPSLYTRVAFYIPWIESIIF
ncbi:serine protease persephone-like isoform X2 [Contarinia nasturtii]|uniref:serine protease persephone-like isoform X2 n=1 Tax=Contarinia nasturtii TaxID=265458 RepID=UPI0012D3FF17|nr:serine protease persephone-like isoform X2 [Contarinia nasturtii]